MSEIELTDKQKIALSSCYNHIVMYKTFKNLGYKNIEDQKFFFLNGFAGSGKTTVISELNKLLTKDINLLRGTYTALTGRACENLMSRGVECNTAHSIFYEPILDKDGNLLYFKLLDDKSIKDAIGDYLIIEETSMFPEEPLNDILDKVDCPIIFVGDEAQLQPFSGESAFDKLVNDERFISSKMISMEEILRTERDSSIDLFANHIRKTGNFPMDMVNNKDIFKEKKSNLTNNWFQNNWKDWDVIACGTNKTRKKFNNLIRISQGFYEDIPQPGERVMCTENTVVSNEQINNGELFEVISTIPGESLSNFIVQKIKGDGKKSNSKTITVTVENDFWTEEQPSDKYKKDKTIQKFVFGYALTVHKLQGSSLPSIVFYDEDVSFFTDQKAFRYTGCTRPSSKLMIVR